jgi:hypothetical protein
MLANGFISDIPNYERLALGKTEKLFLHIISMEPTSVYRISVGLKSGTIMIGETMLTTGIQSMAYKNVHKRVKRLHSLGLIEESKGNFKRNAKMYRLTSRGLFERLLDQSPWLPDILDLYRNNPIIETLVYQYFELETIANFETFPLTELRRYLRRCCEAILNTLDVHRYETKKCEEWSRVYNVEPKDHSVLLHSYLDAAIKDEAKNFVLKIVNMSKDEDPYQSIPNYSNLFPRQALLKDKKFIYLLEEIKNDFDNGSKNFL